MFFFFFDQEPIEMFVMRVSKNPFGIIQSFIYIYILKIGERDICTRLENGIEIIMRDYCYEISLKNLLNFW